MALPVAGIIANYSCYYFTLTLAISLTVISCNNAKCRQNSCPFPTTLPFTSVPTLKQVESISNDLSPIMDSPLDLHKQVYKVTSMDEAVQRKHVPEYMLDIFAQKMQRSVAGKSFDNVRNYRANIPGFFSTNDPHFTSLNSRFFSSKRGSWLYWKHLPAK